MMPAPPTAHLLAELEARHDEVLEKLDQLNRVLEQTLAEWTGRKPQEGGTATQAGTL